MKILMTTCGGVIRGLEAWPEYVVARELVRLGHDIEVLSSTSSMKIHKAQKSEVIEGIKAKRFNPIFPGSLIYMLFKDYDVIHSHHFGYLAPISSYAAIRKKLRKIKIVNTIHGLYHDPYIVSDVQDPFSAALRRTNTQQRFPYSKPLKIPNWFVHLPLFTSDVVVALTNWEKTEVMKFGVPEEKITVIPNSIDVSKYERPVKLNFKKRFSIDGEMLLFLGQPSRRKGYEYLIKSVPGLKKKFPDIKIVFAGYRRGGELEGVCKSLGVEKDVVFTGYLSEDDKIAAFKECDAFVLPTLYEGFGIVFLEAMACGTPIVTTDVAGNSEIVRDGVNGVLVKPKNVDSLVDGIVKIVDNQEFRRVIKNSNLKGVKLYDSKKIVKKYLDVYQS